MQFKLKSKLSSTEYPCLQTIDEILQWLTFAPSVDPYDIDPVVLGRVAAMAKFEGQKHYIISGNRSTAKQAEIYLSRGGVKNSDGTYSDPYKKINGKVAKPNTSDHEIHFAVDSGSKFYKSIETTEHPMKQPRFNKFGLCKPLTTGAGMKKCIEDWHIIPVEVWKITRSEKLKLVAIPIESKPTPKVNPVDLLFSKNIVGSVTFWKSINQVGYADGAFVSTLIRNYCRYITGKAYSLTEAVGFLVNKSLISSGEYWVNVCVVGGKARADYVNILIENMANTIK